jgi:hypothetical protein
VTVVSSDCCFLRQHKVHNLLLQSKAAGSRRGYTLFMYKTLLKEKMCYNFVPLSSVSRSLFRFLFKTKCIQSVISHLRYAANINGGSELLCRSRWEYIVTRVRKAVAKSGLAWTCVSVCTYGTAQLPLDGIFVKFHI